MAAMGDFRALFKLNGPGLDRDELTVPAAGVSFGRSGDNDFVLPSGEISRRHMRFVWEDAEIYVIDQNSSNGVYVNDQRIRADVPYKLSVGEVVRAGPFTLALAELDSPKRRRAEPAPAPQPAPTPPSPVEQEPELRTTPPAPEPEPVPAPPPPREPVPAPPEPQPEPEQATMPPVAAEAEPVAAEAEPEPEPKRKAPVKEPEPVPPPVAEPEREPEPEPESEPEPEPPPSPKKKSAPREEEPVLLFTPVAPDEPLPEQEPEAEREPEPEPPPPPRKKAAPPVEEAPPKREPDAAPSMAAPPPPPEPLPPIERVPFTVGGVPGRFKPPPSSNGHKEQYPVGLPRDVSTWMKYLPEIYGEDDFLGRYLLVFEAMMSPSIWSIDSFDLFLAPETAPTDWLRWIASWFDLVILPELPEDRQRAVLAQAGWLFKRRGTRVGLERMLELYFGVRPEIIEPPNEPFTFVVRMALSESRVKLGADVVQMLVQAHKPAFTVFRLELT